MKLLKILAIYAISIIFCAFFAVWFFQNYLFHPSMDVSSEAMRIKIDYGEKAIGSTVAIFVGGVLGIAVAMTGRMLVGLRFKK